MPDTGGSALSCTGLQHAVRQRRGLTAAESEHLESCEACLEAWLDATVTQTLDAKPEVEIPADFAARVAAGLPEKRYAVAAPKVRASHWGLIAAAVVAAVVLITIAVANPVRVNTWAGMVFLALVVTEVGGIALWLGARKGS